MSPRPVFTSLTFADSWQPHFEFNSVLPNTIIGPSVHPSQKKQFILSMFEGDKGMAEMFPPRTLLSPPVTGIKSF